MMPCFLAISRAALCMAFLALSGCMVYQPYLCPVILSDTEYNLALSRATVVIGPVPCDRMIACTVIDDRVTIYLPFDDPDLLFHEVCHIHRLFSGIPAELEAAHVGWLTH